MKLDVSHFNQKRATANARAKARREKPWVTKIDWRVWRVVGRRPENGKYRVTFTVDADDRRFGECVNILTGEECAANRRGLYCFHLAAAYAKQARAAARLKGKEAEPCEERKAA